MAIFGATFTLQNHIWCPFHFTEPYQKGAKKTRLPPKLSWHRSRIIIPANRRWSAPLIHVLLFLQRPSFCPIKILNPDQAARLPEQIRGRGVDVGVAILLQAANKKVLLTRRTKTLSIFPNVWVPPGGHMEPGEQLLDAGLRELQEETGLDLRNETPPWRILGLWESAFPPLLSRGPPTKHHIVSFLLVTSSKTHQELQVSRPESERSVCFFQRWNVWIFFFFNCNRRTPGQGGGQRMCLAGPGDRRADSGSSGGRGGFWEKPARVPTSIQVTEVSGNSLSRRDVDVSVFLNTAPVGGEDVERVNTGTKYALELWLETLQAQEKK
ncbi:m7GpppN-mRNA hydrolase NUDT17-like [Lithobates pipiens]